jgi:uncharacterized membrane protein
MPLEPVISRVAFRGHPLHPTLIHFPIAALIGLVGTDLAYFFSEDPFWARAGLWLAGVGALGGAVSGLAGLVDLLVVPRIRRLVTAWGHGIMAVMLLSLASFNWLLRVSDPVALIIPWGLFLSLLSALLISMTGYLGGRLVYEYAVGVNVEEAAAVHSKT